MDQLIRFFFKQQPSEEVEDENDAESELNGQSEQNCLTNSDDALGQLSGEEDPWVVCTQTISNLLLVIIEL